MDLILSDIHANLHALRVVLKYARGRRIERFIFLGDLVGYGANPNEVLDEVRALPNTWIIRGNHDRACAFEDGDPYFSLPARLAAAWTRVHLQPDHQAFLKALPSNALKVDEDFVIAHGTPGDEDAYLLQARDALHAFDAFEGPLCFFGHTHLPGLFELDEAGGSLAFHPLRSGEWRSLKQGCRYLINPGSVGQPRDRDPRLSFLAYDRRRRRVKLLRLDYDFGAAAAAIRAAGLHVSLADRLAIGI